jgi:hypothetical protein
MQTRRFLMAFLLLAAVAVAGGVGPAWIKHYTGPSQSQVNEAADSYLDTLTGNLYVVGSGELASNPNGCDLVVVKYRPDGTRAWVNGFGGTAAGSDDIAQAVAVDSVGNVYIAGMTDNEGPQFSDAAWAKYDSNGNELWHRTSTWNGYDVAYGIAIGRAGDVYICGSDSGYNLLSGYMVARIDPSDGDTIWKRSFVLDTEALARRYRGQDVHPDYFEDYGYWDNCAVSIAAMTDSGVVTTGHGSDFDREFEWWTMRFTPSGTLSWATTYRNPLTTYDDDDVAFDVAAANNGDIYAVGFDYYETGSTSQGYNYAIVRYSSSGSRLGYRSFDVASEHGDDYAFSVALDDSSPQNVYVTGTLAYPYPLNEQISTMKFSNTLTSRWGPAGATYGSSDDDRGYSVYYRMGKAYVTGRIGDDLFVLGYSAANASPKDTLWSYSYDDADGMEDFGASICALDSDHVYVSGEASHAGTPSWTSIYTARFRYGRPEMAVTAINAPQGAVDHYDTVIPRATIMNNGDVIPMINAFMYIGLPYGDTIQVFDGPAPGQSATISFKPWAAHPTGLVQARCSIEVEDDTIPANDFYTDTVRVIPIDAGCLRIASPVGAVDSGTTVVPIARFKNFGTTRQTFPVWFRIETRDSTASGLPHYRATGMPLQVYEDSAAVTLAPQESADVSFSDWTASPLDTFNMKAFTALYGDDNQSNDTVRAQLIVQPAPGVESPESMTGIPREYLLGSPRPNPFVDRLVLSFALPIRSSVSLRVYDAAGALVRTLTAAEMPAGFHYARWNGTDERGLRVKAGTYFCRMQAPGYSRITKLIVTN